MTINNDIGYVVKLNTNCSFNEYGDILTPNGKYTCGICNDTDGVLRKYGYMLVATSLFNLLANPEFIEHDEELYNIKIYEVKHTEEIIDDNLVFVYCESSVTKLNEIDYEIFYNYITSNIDNIIIWVNTLIKNNNKDILITRYILQIFSNLYAMNICREYIKDIAENNTYIFSNELLNSINAIEMNIKD